jgi:hypothetical protein
MTLDQKTESALCILDDALRGNHPDIEDELDDIRHGRFVCENLVSVLRHQTGGKNDAN